MYLSTPWFLRGKESSCQCRRRGFEPWVGKILWRRKWQLIPVFLPEESHGQRSLGGLQSLGSQRVRYDWVIKQQEQQWLGRCLKASISACSVPLMCSAMYSLKIQVKWAGIPFKYCRFQLGSKALKPQSSVAANSEQCVLGTHFSQHNHEQAVPWLLWV